MAKPLAIDLYSGLGGWAEGFLAERYDVVGFDIERHQYGEEKYPAQLVLQDVLTLHGSQFRDAACIVASPPCQAYSYRAMPWKRAKALPPPDNTLFFACFRIQDEACAAAGRHIPLIVENVKGAQPWVGRASWHFGSFYLWGDVPALMPIITFHRNVPGMNFHDHEKTGQPGRSFQSAAANGIKNSGGSWFKIAHNTESGVANNPVSIATGMKGTGGGWFEKPYKERGDITGPFNSKSPARKQASAMIAKIPFALSSHIARSFYESGVPSARRGG